MPVGWVMINSRRPGSERTAEQTAQLRCSVKSLGSRCALAIFSVA